jgi:hypothetical protein
MLIPDLKSHVGQQNAHPVTAGILTQKRGNVWQLSVAMMALVALMMELGTEIF